MLPAELTPAILLSTGGALAALLTVTIVIRKVWRVPEFADPAVALLRALVQLALLSFVLSIAITRLEYVVCALIIMMSFGVWTASKRLGVKRATVGLVALAMVTGVLLTLTIVFGTRALPLTGQNLLAYGGILTGNAMSIVTLAGRRFTQDVKEHWSEIEGWLALGAQHRTALSHIASHSMSEALIPNVDQTRVTGIVTMPGAFVGAVFAGASPLEAGRFQLLVLAGIMMVGTIAAAILMRGSDPIAVAVADRTTTESTDDDSK